ncbi:MAG: hypothetical protein BAJALOKI2v1_920006 [Promethearchaeota archaeon]|nr:MAG: hypothetical protein BAJALOKI2v1_920006 [Candidatus Lokiarchaeota archaeon]
MLLQTRIGKLERTQEKISNSYKFKLVNCYLITYKIFNRLLKVKSRRFHIILLFPFSLF